MDGLVLVTPLDAANRCPKADGLVELLAALAVIGCVPRITRWGASWTQPKRRRPQLHNSLPIVTMRRIPPTGHRNPILAMFSHAA
jgi:hypothetical protein